MRSLGSLESAVMKLLWDAGEPVSVRQVADRLRGRDLAYTTVATVLKNLHQKEWVDREHLGRVWFYRPRVQASEYAAQLMHEALTSSDSPRATFVKFVDEITDEDATLLRELLAEGPPSERE